MTTKIIGSSTPDALRLPSDLVSSLAKNLLRQRESRLVQSKLIARLKKLDTAVGQLERQAVAFEVGAEELRPQDASANSEDIEIMRESARIVRATQDPLKQRRQDLRQKFEDITEEIDTVATELYDLLHHAFVQRRVIPPQSNDLVAARVEGAPEKRPAARMNDEASMQHTKTDGPNSDQEAAPGLKRSAGSQNLRLEAANSLGAGTAAQGDVIPRRDPKFEAERDYKLYKLFLGQAENDFETRQDVFDQERDQLLLKRQIGQTDESISQLDKRHILATQKLAQIFAKAEEEFCAAKEAAVAAGVVFGSDAESGFVSGPDDGYSLSMEIGGEMFVDRQRIDRWLTGLQLFKTNDDQTAALEDDPTDRDSAKESNDFDLESVEICDTRSAIAEGPWRRRIENWNLIRGERISEA